MNILSDLANKRLDLIPRMASLEIIDTLMKLLQSQNPEEHSTAIGCFAAFFVSEDDSIIQKAIQRGFLTRIFELLNISMREDKVKILFALTNITGG